jgi:hypothetical protein
VCSNLDTVKAKENTKSNQKNSSIPSNKAVDLIDWTNTENYKQQNIARQNSLDNNFQNFEFVESSESKPQKQEGLEFDLNELEFVSSLPKESQPSTANNNTQQKNTTTSSSIPVNNKDQTIYDFF